jgi:thiamine biosynthesis lipoprotein
MLRCLCCLWPLLSVAAAEPYVFYHENVLGTGLELQVQTDSQAVADRAEAAALAEIDRLATVLSTYTTDSELSRWRAAGVAVPLSPDLVAVLRASDGWQAATGRAFHPGTELFTQLWRQAERTGTPPTDADLQPLVHRLREPPWTWSGASTATPTRDYPISLNAIAKGAIIERACRTMHATPGVTGALVKIGGDLRVMGTLSSRIDIPSPTRAGDAATVLDRITLQNRALATSSGTFRGVTIAGRWYSHLIDPRTGRPVEHIRSATVIAADAADADALATACSVLSVDESLSLLNATPDVAGLLFDHEGQLHRSRRWPNQTILAQAEPAKPQPWNGGMELEVRFEINQPAAGGRYRRPYLAVWIEDGDGFPVRTLVLWVQTSGPGPRWIPDLKRWYRSDRVRKAADGTDLVATISEATRKPGQYNVLWDGRDDADQPVKPGDYTLYIEAAREHGTYQLLRKPITVRNQPFRHELEANTEIKSATLEYRKQKPATATGTGD